MNEEPMQSSSETSSAPPLENLLGKRIAAGLIDLVIVAVIGVVFTVLFGDTKSDDGGFNASLSGAPFLIYVLIAFAYYFLMEASSGQTVGKMALGIKVVAANGTKASAGKIAIRTILRIVDGFLFYIVGILVIAFSGKHQRIGDMAGNTIVVSAK
jgi:uncharacterized RDD family membrane protein YckC